MLEPDQSQKVSPHWGSPFGALELRSGKIGWMVRKSLRSVDMGSMYCHGDDPTHEEHLNYHREERRDPHRDSLGQLSDVSRVTRTSLGWGLGEKCGVRCWSPSRGGGSQCGRGNDRGDSKSAITGREQRITR